MADSRTIELARAALIRRLETSLAEIAESFKGVVTVLEDIDERTAEERANFMFANDGGGRNVWGSMTFHEAGDLRSVLAAFDKIVSESQTGAAKFEIKFYKENWKGESGPDKLDNLAGIPALVKQYVDKAKFTVTVEPIVAGINLVCTR